MVNCQTTLDSPDCTALSRWYGSCVLSSQPLSLYLSIMLKQWNCARNRKVPWVFLVTLAKITLIFLLELKWFSPSVLHSWSWAAVGTWAVGTPLLQGGRPAQLHADSCQRWVALITWWRWRCPPRTAPALHVASCASSHPACLPVNHSWK